MRLSQLMAATVRQLNVSTTFAATQHYVSYNVGWHPGQCVCFAGATDGTAPKRKRSMQDSVDHLRRLASETANTAKQTVAAGRTPALLEAQRHTATSKLRCSLYHALTTLAEVSTQGAHVAAV